MAEESQIERTDRRAASREPIQRRVVFSGVRGEGLLRQGIAMDISASGLLIHTPNPDLVGRHLEVELHGDKSVTPGNVIMVRAEVAWVKPLAEREMHAMGVRFLQSVPATDVTGAGYRPAGREESARLAESIRRSLEGADPGVRLELSDAAKAKSQAVKMAPARKEKKQRRWPRFLFWLLFLLVFSALVMLLSIALLTWLESLKRGPASAQTGEEETAQSPREQPQPLETDSGVSSSVRDDVIAARIDTISDEGPAFYVNRGSYWLSQGRFPAAAQAFRAAQSRSDATPIERYIAQLGEAEALAREGDVAGALALLESPFEGLDQVPLTWRTLKEEFRDGLLATPGLARARAPMVNAFTFAKAESQPGDSSSGATAGDEQTESTGIRIEIDTTRHLLNVLEDNSIQAIYPVGLGARDLTPEGAYTIINKIEDPDWYNNGDVVPAGDPENQLGSRWLGLANDGGPTQLGIHATDELESIGGNQSRGCIRMRPADIVELFERIPVGTPVAVRAI